MLITEFLKIRPVSSDVKIVTQQVSGHGFPKFESNSVARSEIHIDQTFVAKILVDVKKLAPDGPLRLKTLKAIIKRRGLRLRPISTLNLVENALDDVFSPTPVGETVALGEISLPVKKVKKEK